MKTLKQWLSWFKSKDDDIVDVTSEESFPASDPPAWAASDYEDRLQHAKITDPILMLKSEHQLIMKIIYKVHEQIELLEKNQPLKESSIQKIIQFMHRFVDKSHHQKEENYLFPALEKCGAPITDVSIDDFRKDHAQGLILVNALEKYAALYARQEPSAREKLIEVMSELKDIYTRHTLKEENFVFPLVEKYLSKSEQKHLFDQFEKVDADSHI